MKTPLIEIELDEDGRGVVKVDGHNIASCVAGISIETQPREVSRVTLELWAHRIKVKMPATVIAEIREGFSLDDELANRTVERVLSAINDCGTPLPNGEALDRLTQAVADRLGRRAMLRGRL